MSVEDTDEFDEGVDESELFEDDVDSNEEKMEKLLSGIEENREHYKSMLNDVEKLRGQIDNLLPSNMDYKKKFLFEERMKTISSILGTELDIRKSLEASYKLEFDLRKKHYDEVDDGENKSDKIDMIARALSKMNTENKKSNIVNYKGKQKQRPN